jgi:branched-chain amino acid aminotransferase
MIKDQPIAYLKGDFVAADECRLPVYDLGIVLGAAVTDFLRTFNGKPFRMEEHIERFYRSCKYACIKPPVDIDESIEISLKLIKHNLDIYGGKDLGLVFYMTAGSNFIYAGSAGGAGEYEASYVQHTFPLPVELWRTIFTEGARCVTPSIRHVPPATLSSKIKHRNRLHMWIGEQEAHQRDPGAIPLFLDIHGNITETGGSNFVIYKDGAVVSPAPANILRGLSLVTLFEILDEMKIPWIEQDIQPFDVVNADEAWIPTTPYCLGPVVQINGQPIGDGRPGPLWRKIIDRWSERVSKDIYREITGA